MPRPSTIDNLKRQLVALGRRNSQMRQGFTLGAIAVDAVLGSLSRGVLHEVLSAKVVDSASATGFALALAQRCAANGPILWVRHEVVDAEVGQLYAPGIAEIGLDPAQIVLVRARTAAEALYAAEEAARCPAIQTVLLEIWGRSASLNLTATRRLAFAAEKSGVTALLLRRGAEPEPSAAETRWLAQGAPSRPLDANAPGFPVFHLTLLRHRKGIIGRDWKLEWIRDRKSFEEWSPLSRPLATVASHRPITQFSGSAQIKRAG